MATLTAPGIGSGLDINTLVAQLVALERAPVQTRLDRQEITLQAKLSAYGTLKGAIAAFQSAVRGLSDLSTYQARTATSADTEIYTATASPGAVAGTYSIEVKQLAQAHKLASKAFTNVTDTVGTGTLTIQFGTFSGGTFTANAAKATQTVTIDSTNSTLEGIRDAINAAKIGVDATILNDGTGYKLILTSAETGAANSLKITVSNDGDGNDVDDGGLSQLAYDPEGSAGSGKNMTETVAAQNALLKVDGIDNISKASNTVTDVIQGVTLTLLKESAANTSTLLTVSRDTDSVKSAVKQFVQAYNDLNSKVTELTAYDTETETRAVLQSDASALAVTSRVRRILNTPLTGLSGAYDVLSAIGVTFQKDGTLALDESKLDGAMDANFDDIAPLFANQGKPTDSLVKYAGATDKTQPGRYALTVTQLASRGYLNGTATAALADSDDDGTFDAAFVIDGNNDALNLKVDGVASGTITLAQGSYATAAALTAEIQSKINGDSALKAAGVTVTVSFDNVNDRLVITSDRYGSASTVEITAVDTASGSTLGLSVASGTAGVDVAGSIGGVTASGSGRFLTGATGSAAEGLKVEVLGGATGSRGTVDYSQGYAYQLDKLMDQFLGNAGMIASRTDNIEDALADIAQQREALERRLETVERRYRAQFTALDILLSQLQTTSTFLAQQLANLPGSRTILRER